MSSEQKEKRILLISFLAGLAFAVVEVIFAIYSHSQSAMMDGVYDATELIFIALILFLTPLFHKPISEKRPYGFFQVESIFLIIKGFMMLSVTFTVTANVIESALHGGNPVNSIEISLFQFVLGLASVVIYFIMRHLNKSLSSPTVDAELLGWKLDIFYSLGLSIAFFVSTYLEKIPKLAPFAPYFDQLMAVLIVMFMLPENIQMLGGAIKDVFLFSPDEDTVNSIKNICDEALVKYSFEPVFYDITRTGRHLWVSIYFEVAEPVFKVNSLTVATQDLNSLVSDEIENCTIELILSPKNLPAPVYYPEEN